MGRVVASAAQLVQAMTDAATGLDSLAASGSVSLGPALLPLIALAGSLTAAVAVGSLVIAWLRKPELQGDGADTDPRTAGLLAVGFVSGIASQRWLPATVVQLAVDHRLTIDDRRNGNVGAAGSGHLSNEVRLVVGGAEPPAVRMAVSTGDPSSRDASSAGASGGDASTGDVSSRAEDRVVEAMFEPTHAGGSLTLVPGSSVEVDRVVNQNGTLREVTKDRFVEAAERYREPRPGGRFRTATIGSAVGIVGGLFSTGLGETSASIGWSAVVIGALALGLRILLPRWIPLNAAGLLLRQRSNELREAVVSAEVPSMAAARQLLPWAVLFDEPAVIRRVADVAERTRTPPSWYHSIEEFSADRFVGCLTVLTRELSQPIRVGAKAPWMGDESRFGVPMIGDTKGWGGGYFVGDGGSGIAGYGDGVGGGFGDGGMGGFDGGGFGGGGDGGGF